MSHAEHHYHKRKRIHKKHEKFPHPDPVRRMVDKLIYVVGMSAPIFYIPQIYKIFSNKEAGDIAIITFISFLVANLFWVWYGTLHKEKPIVVIHGSLVLANIAIIGGALLYG